MCAQERNTLVGAAHARTARGAGGTHVELGAGVGGVGVCKGPQAAAKELDLGRSPPVRQVEQVQEVHAAGGLQHVVDAAHHVAAGDQHRLVDVCRHHALDEALPVAAEVGVGQRVRICKGRDVRLGKARRGPKACQQLCGGVLAGVIYPSLFALFRWHGFQS